MGASQEGTSYPSPASTPRLESHRPSLGPPAVGEVPGSTSWLRHRNEVLEGERLEIVKKTLEVQAFLDSVKGKARTAIEISSGLVAAGLSPILNLHCYTRNRLHLKLMADTAGFALEDEDGVATLDREPAWAGKAAYIIDEKQEMIR
eukprot:2826051-Rhodomonas_salina.2